MRFLTTLFLLSCSVCQGQSYLGIGASSGVSNFIPGRYQEPSRDYVLPAPVNVTVGKAFRIDSAIIYFYGRYEAGVANGFLIGPGVRLYSGKGFGMPNSLSPYFDFYPGYFTTGLVSGVMNLAGFRKQDFIGRTAVIAAAGATYFVRRNEGIDFQVGFWFNELTGPLERHENALISIGYHRFIPIKSKNRLRRQRRQKPGDCPARYD
jgi:hypothetical protein